MKLVIAEPYPDAPGQHAEYAMSTGICMVEDGHEVHLELGGPMPADWAELGEAAGVVLHTCPKRVPIVRHRRNLVPRYVRFLRVWDTLTHARKIARRLSPDAVLALHCDPAMAYWPLRLGGLGRLEARTGCVVHSLAGRSAAEQALPTMQRTMSAESRRVGLRLTWRHMAKQMAGAAAVGGRPLRLRGETE